MSIHALSWPHKVKWKLGYISNLEFWSPYVKSSMIPIYDVKKSYTWSQPVRRKKIV